MKRIIIVLMIVLFAYGHWAIADEGDETETVTASISPKSSDIERGLNSEKAFLNHVKSIHSSADTNIDEQIYKAYDASVGVAGFGVGDCEKDMTCLVVFVDTIPEKLRSDTTFFLPTEYFERRPAPSRGVYPRADLLIRLIKEYPSSSYREQAIWRFFELFQGAPNFLYDGPKFLEKYPQSDWKGSILEKLGRRYEAVWNECIDSKKNLKGKTCENARLRAIHFLDRLLTEHPDHGAESGWNKWIKISVGNMKNGKHSGYKALSKHYAPERWDGLSEGKLKYFRIFEE